MKNLMRAIAFVGVLCLSACGSPTKQEILKKTSSIKTKDELEKVMGAADVNKLGPLETWKYKASDGEVVFVIVGDKVKLQAAGSEKEKEK